MQAVARPEALIFSHPLLFFFLLLPSLRASDKESPLDRFVPFRKLDDLAHSPACLLSFVMSLLLHVSLCVPRFCYASMLFNIRVNASRGGQFASD